MEATGSCLGCTDRYVGCHATCSKYAEWSKEHHKQKDIEYNNRCKEKFFARYVRERNVKLLRYREV